MKGKSFSDIKSSPRHTSHAQVDFGAPFPPFFSSLLSTKLRSSPNLLREVSLAKRFTAPELYKAGVVDEIVPAAKLRGRAVEFGNEIGLKSAQGPWGLIKVSSVSCFRSWMASSAVLGFATRLRHCHS